MKFHMVDAHYDLMMKALDAMSAFADNDMLPLFTQMARAYNVDDKEAAACAERWYELGLTAPAAGSDWIRNFRKKLDAENRVVATDRVNPNPRSDERYTRILTLEGKERNHLSAILDAYSRLMSGQFEIIFDYLDIKNDAAELSDEELARFHDAYWTGACGCLKIRNTLVADCNGMDWMSHLGITSNELCEESKLAYEMYHIFERPDDFVLFVSGHSMMLGED